VDRRASNGAYGCGIIFTEVKEEQMSKTKNPTLDLYFDYSVSYKDTAIKICSNYRLKNNIPKYFGDLPNEIYLINGIIERTDPLSVEERYWLNVRKHARLIISIRESLI
jgi:hypothetical protein